MAGARGARPSLPREPTKERRMRTARTLVVVSMAGALVALASPRAEAVDCARRLLAGGGHIPAGHEVEADERHPNHLLDDHLSKRCPRCNYHIAVNETTSGTYITAGQLAQTWN